MVIVVGGVCDVFVCVLCEFVSVVLDEDEIEYVFDGVIDVDGMCVLREEFVEFVWFVIVLWVDDDEVCVWMFVGDVCDGVDVVEMMMVEEMWCVDCVLVCLGEGWCEGVEWEDAARRATAAAAGVVKMFVGKDGCGDVVELRVGMWDWEKVRWVGECLVVSVVDEWCEMVVNLTAARERAARACVEGCVRVLLNVEFGFFVVLNLGGGVDLIEDVSVMLVLGR